MDKHISTYFYIARLGESQGPFTMEELRDHAISPDTLVWHEGLSDWQPAGEVDVLKRMFIKEVGARIQTVPEIQTKPMKTPDNRGDTIGIAVGLFILFSVCILLLWVFWMNYKKTQSNAGHNSLHTEKPLPALQDEDFIRIKEKVQQWNQSLVTQNIVALDQLYADEVNYYGEMLSRDEVILQKKKFLTAYSDFNQSITGELEFEKVGANYKVTFPKRASFNLKSLDLKAFLVFRFLDPEWKISMEQDNYVEESDKVNSNTEKASEIQTVVPDKKPNPWRTAMVHCNLSPTVIVEVRNPVTGRVWMDRNLGASRVATSSTDKEAYGDLYQWGRFADGHQCRNSVKITKVISSNTPGHGRFILAEVNSKNDWRSPQNDNLWQGVNGINNPCPTGFRLPTESEWEAERQSWNSNSSAGAMQSPLKLPLGGYRYFRNGSLSHVAASGSYWSARVSVTFASNLFFFSNDAFLSTNDRGDGLSVRCLQD